MSRAAPPLLNCVLACGAIAAYDGLAHYVSTFPDSAHWASLLTLGPIAAFALALIYRHLGWQAAALGGVMAAMAARQAWPALQGNMSALYLCQYLGTNLALGTYFGRTLTGGRTPACTGFAALLHPRQSPALLSYTRRVTVAWTIFFLGSAAASLSLYLLAPIQIWSVFSNLLYLPSLALMFIAEGLARHLVLPPEDRHGIIDSLRAYLASTQPAARLARNEDGPPGTYR